MQQYLYAIFLSFFVMAQPGYADPAAWRSLPDYALRLHVTSAAQTYGLFVVAATDTSCAYVRYRISVAGHAIITPALPPGGAIVVEIPGSTPVGLHPVTVAAVGCRADFSLLRSVVRHKRSPDHGARALAALACKDQGQPYHRQTCAAPA